MSTSSSSATNAPRVEDRGRGDRPLVLRLLRHPTGAPSSILLVLLIAVAVFGPWLTPHDPGTTDISQVHAAPGGEHLLGTDSAGRDVLSRLLAGTAYSLIGGVVVAAVAAAFGITGGLIAGFFGGWADTAGAWITALVMSLPPMVVLLAARAAFGPSLWLSLALFGVMLSPTYYRVIYNAVRAVTAELYIDAARTSGLSTTRIIARHVLQAVRAPAILLAAGILAGGIGIMAALDFLGVGATDESTWGQMLSAGFYELTTNPLLVVWPATALGLTMMALVLFGAALRDELEGTADPVPAHKLSAWEPEETPEAPILHEAAEDGSAGPPDDDAPLLQVRDLAVAYPAPDGSWATVVRRSSLTIGRGRIHGLVGESGSGKSQTAFAVMGLLGEGGRAVAGSVVFDGEELIGRDDAALNRLRGRRIAYVPQEPMSNLNPAFTVGAQFTDPLRRVLGLSRAEAEQRARTLLDRVGIPDPDRVMRSYPHQLSGGMAQRVLIAAAVASHPDLLIADEPTTALDVTVQAEVLDLLREFRDELGMSILLVTHSFGVVADICDHVTVMERGVVVETGPVEPVFDGPRHPYTRQLFDAVPTGRPRAAVPASEGADA